MSDGQAVMSANDRYYLGAPDDRADRDPQLSRLAHRVGRHDAWRRGLPLGSRSRTLWTSCGVRRHVRVFSRQRPYGYVIFLNEHAHALRSPLIRRALNAAIDRKQLIKQALQGYGSPEASPIWPKNWAYDPSAPRFEYDPVTAARWLHEAGFAHRARPVEPRAQRSFVSRAWSPGLHNRRTPRAGGSAATARTRCRPAS